MRLTAWNALLGRSPLTDPRSLVSSLLFHVALLVVASAAALSVSAPAAPEASHALRGELDPTDNRAPATEGGGAPGELGGTSLLEALPVASGESPSGATREPSAESLLAEILPTPRTTDAAERALPGPQTSGLGVLPGPGLGGGGGSGGGSGGGVGRGVGPGTEFFGAREHAGSFAYVIDRSGSMATRGSLNMAKRELTASLNQLPPDAKFAVIFYELSPTVLTDPLDRPGMMAATTVNKARVAEQLSAIGPDGGTDHLSALRVALALKPEVIFFLTDAEQMITGNAQTIIAEAGKTRIQAIEFGRGSNLAGANDPLRQLATATGGSYRYIDVMRFPQPGR